MNNNNDLGELIKKLNELEARLVNNESSLNEFLDEYESTLSEITDLLKVKEKEYSESLNALNKSSIENEYNIKSLSHNLVSIVKALRTLLNELGT